MATDKSLQADDLEIPLRDLDFWENSISGDCKEQHHLTNNDKEAASIFSATYEQNAPIDYVQSQCPYLIWNRPQISIYSWHGIIKRAKRIGVAAAIRLCYILALLLVAVIVAILIKKWIEPSQYNYKLLHFDWNAGPENSLIPIGIADSANNTYNVRLDGHAHTTVSDGQLSPSQLVDWAVVVSDHNTVEGGLQARSYAETEYPGKILIIPGQEYSCCRIHMNFLNINHTVPVGPPEPTNEDLRHAIDEVHRQGGLAVVNHIPWSNRTSRYYQLATLPNHPSREELLDMGVDGFELINGDTFDYPSFQFLRQRLVANPNSRPVFAITGSDLHQPDGAYAWTVLQTSNFSVSAIMDELRAGRTKFLFNPAGTRLRSYPENNKRWEMLAPFIYLNDYLASMYQIFLGMPSFQGGFCQTTSPQFHFRMLFSLFICFLVIWKITTTNQKI
ncbi:Polymerase/histidinol phosphatase-like protein [Syncephalis fuscata]|nr:Polymerase/histidinol phosphatase-like protein [Syncephalis fuscata]